MLCGEVVPIVASHVEQRLAGLQFWDVGRLGALVPGTGLLAAVAPVDGGAELVTDALVERSSVLYGLKREAALGVER